MNSAVSAPGNFSRFNLSPAVLKALNEVGYETPTPIQAQTIPLILAGGDVVGQAQTGTGKTAAFALPLLTRIDLKNNHPQVLVLTPTRELAIQVAEAFHRYATHMKNFHVLPIYGGQEYGVQLRQLKRGVHVVVGTPGRVMDHMRRGTLKLEGLKCLVLDEGDEMLRMGFIDDIEWILEQTPTKHQIALFSATMPEPIRKIARKYLENPEQITIQVKTTTAETIKQSFIILGNGQKLEALTRILEATGYSGVLIFVRTKVETIELAEKLSARGYVCAALNGDISQKIREQTVNKLKNGKLDILIATDVAARGLDVERISHVINYDIPNDPEAYVHRIGRTGRAGRSGEAILFVTNREKHLLNAIERSTRQKIEMYKLPTPESIKQDRITKFKQKISDTLTAPDLDEFRSLLEQYQIETGSPLINIASALAKLAQGKIPLLVTERNIPEHDTKEFNKNSGRKKPGNRDNPRKVNRHNSTNKESLPDEDMERFRIEVGSKHGAKPGNIVGAIANEAGLESNYIRKLTILETHSLVDLPAGMPRDIFRELKKTRVAGRQLNISRLAENEQQTTMHKSHRKGRKKKKDKH